MFSLINNIARVVQTQLTPSQGACFDEEQGVDQLLKGLECIQANVKRELSEKCFLYKLIQLIKRLFDKGDYPLIKNIEDVKALVEFASNNFSVGDINDGQSMRIGRGLLFVLSAAYKNREDTDISTVLNELINCIKRENLLSSINFPGKLWDKITKIINKSETYFRKSREMASNGFLADCSDGSAREEAALIPKNSVNAPIATHHDAVEKNKWVENKISEIEKLYKKIKI